VDRLPVDEYFDRLYRDCERYWWQGRHRYSTDPESHPTSLVTQQTLRLLQDRTPGRALDLGAGEGADAIRLAHLGYEVDAVDVSPVAAEKIDRFAKDEGVSSRVRVTLGDVADVDFAGEYDVVLCNGLLHYIEDKAPVITRMQRATAVGGFNVVSLWSTFTPVPKAHNSVTPFCDEEDGVVTRLYRPWPKELIYFERNKREASHNDLPPHSHSHIKLIARRPA
jgi:SAM-dependent methyltransferase